jgi:4-hydroxy-3-methylbut-2-enyl diphosphate reductase
VAPSVFEEARERDIEFIDATCPLVTKVHLEVRRSARAGKTIVLIGHSGHDEVLGTLGQAPARVRLVQNVEDVQRLQVEDPEQLYYVTQTTLSVDETREVVESLRERFPRIQGPAKADICYATQNRQDAVKELVKDGMDLLLVVGSQNSSNSRRLVEVARENGVDGYLVDSAGDLVESWLDGRSHVGVTAGASAPEDLVQELVGRLVDLGGILREQVVTTEDVSFALPSKLRSKLASSPDSPSWNPSGNSAARSE